MRIATAFLSLSCGLAVAGAGVAEPPAPTEPAVAAPVIPPEEVVMGAVTRISGNLPEPKARHILAVDVHLPGTEVEMQATSTGPQIVEQMGDPVVTAMVRSLSEIGAVPKAEGEPSVAAPPTKLPPFWGLRE